MPKSLSPSRMRIECSISASGFSRRSRSVASIGSAYRNGSKKSATAKIPANALIGTAHVLRMVGNSLATRSSGRLRDHGAKNLRAVMLHWPCCATHFQPVRSSSCSFWCSARFQARTSTRLLVLLSLCATRCHGQPRPFSLSRRFSAASEASRWRTLCSISRYGSFR